MQTEALKLHLLAATDLITALEDAGYRATLIGGLAISLVVGARYTRDVDALVLLDIDDLPALYDVLARRGFSLLFSDALDFARLNRLLPLRHIATGIKVDLALGAIPFEEEVIDRSVRKSALSVTVNLPSPEDLFIMKVLANRPKDTQDLVSLAELYPQMDRIRIQTYLEEFSSLDGMPDLWAIAQPYLAMGQ